MACGFIFAVLLKSLLIAAEPYMFNNNSLDFSGENE
jgi:hypothetical protein